MLTQHEHRDAAGSSGLTMMQQHYQNDVSFLYSSFRDQGEGGGTVIDQHQQEQEQEHHGAEGFQPKTYRGGELQFPWMLHKLLEEASQDGHDAIISWMPCGRLFKVHNRDLFVAKVLPSYVRQSKYKSFARSLNLWGFTTCRRCCGSVYRGAYFHPKFIRGKISLAHDMVRIKIKSQLPRGCTYCAYVKDHCEHNDVIVAESPPLFLASNGINNIPPNAAPHPTIQPSSPNLLLQLSVGSGCCPSSVMAQPTDIMGFPVSSFPDMHLSTLDTCTNGIGHGHPSLVSAAVSTSSTSTGTNSNNFYQGDHLQQHYQQQQQHQVYQQELQAAHMQIISSSTGNMMSQPSDIIGAAASSGFSSSLPTPKPSTPHNANPEENTAWLDRLLAMLAADDVEQSSLDGNSHQRPWQWTSRTDNAHQYFDSNALEPRPFPTSSMPTNILGS